MPDPYSAILETPAWAVLPSHPLPEYWVMLAFLIAVAVRCVRGIWRVWR